MYVLHKSIFYELVENNGSINLELKVGIRSFNSAITTDILLTNDFPSSSYRGIKEHIESLEREQSLTDDSIYYDYHVAIRDYISGIENRNTRTINFQISNNQFISDFDFSRYPFSKYSYEIKLAKNRRIRISEINKIVQYRYDLPNHNKIELIILEKEVMNSLRKLRVIKGIFISKFQESLNDLGLIDRSTKKILKSSDIIPNEITPTSFQQELLSDILFQRKSVAMGLAGTGKTTMSIIGANELIAENKRVLVLSTTHRVLDNFINMLLDVNSKVSSKILRLTTKNTKRSVTGKAKEFISDNIYETVRKDTIARLNSAIEEEQDERIKELQVQMKNILSSRHFRVFESIIAKSKLIVFSTIDSLFIHNEITPDRIDLGKTTKIIPDFDLVIFEDSSDINFIDFNLHSQKANRWVITGDVNQIAPILHNLKRIPKFKQQSFPPLNQITKVKNLNKITFLSKSSSSQISALDKKLKTSALEVITNYANNETKYISLLDNFRFSKQIHTMLLELFSFYNCNEPKTLVHVPSIFINKPLIVLDGNPHSDAKQDEFGLIQDEKFENRESYTNKEEINIIYDTLSKLLNSGVKNLKIGIVTPFRGQTELLRDFLQKEDIQEDLNIQFENDVWTHGEKEIEIELETIHGNKSRQFDICIISMAKSDFDEKSIMSKSNFLFTALSRATITNFLIFDISRYNKWTHSHRRRRPSWFVDHPWYKLLSSEKYFDIDIFGV